MFGRVTRNQELGEQKIVQFPGKLNTLGNGNQQGGQIYSGGKAVKM